MSMIDTIVRARFRQRSVLREVFAFTAGKAVLWSHLARSRKQLSKLSDEALTDIGLSREVAKDEASRPFWETSYMTRRRDS